MIRHVTFGYLIFWWALVISTYCTNRHTGMQVSMDVNFGVCSVCSCWIPHVVLEPSVLSRVVQWQCSWRQSDLWHFGAYWRLVFRIRRSVQGRRRHVRLDTHRAGFGWWYLKGLLVRSEVFRRRFRQRRKLHVYVAQDRFWTNRRTTWRYSTANTIAHSRYYGVQFSAVDAIQYNRVVDTCTGMLFFVVSW